MSRVKNEDGPIVGTRNVRSIEFAKLQRAGNVVRRRVPKALIACAVHVAETSENIGRLANNHAKSMVFDYSPAGPPGRNAFTVGLCISDHRPRPNGKQRTPPIAPSILPTVRMRRRVWTAADADEHAQNLSEWNQTYDQISRGRFSGRITEQWTDKAQVFLRIDQPAASIVRPWEHSIWFGIPRPTGPLRHRLSRHF